MKEEDRGGECEGGPRERGGERAPLVTGDEGAPSESGGERAPLVSGDEGAPTERPLGEIDVIDGRGLTADAILPLLAGRRISWSIHAYGSVGSTNSVARILAEAGAAEGALVVAETQTSGHGRRGTVWHSPQGGLWFSFVLRPHLPPERAAGLSVVAAIAVARAIEQAAGLTPRIKWPNDVFVGDAKLAGAMTSSAGEAVIVGVGVNVNVAPEDLPRSEWYRACSLLTLVGRPFSRSSLLSSILSEFETRYFAYRSPDHAALMDEWRQLSLVFGEEVAVRRGDESMEGTVFGLEDDGGIVLRLRDGRHEKIRPTGDVTLSLL